MKHASGPVQLPNLILSADCGAAQGRTDWPVMRHFLLLLVFALGAALAASGASADQGRQGQERGGKQRQQQGSEPGLSLDAAVRQAERQYNARVIRAETRTSSDGRRVHVLRLLSEDGRVWTVKIDAASGAEG